MKLSELKQLIKEEIQAALNENTPRTSVRYNGIDYEVIEDYGTAVKVKMGSKVRTLNNSQLTQSVEKEKKYSSVKEAEEKEYKVEYWYRFGKYGDDEDYEVVKVMATSEEEAIEKAKQEARRASYKFKVIK
jgi:hypothetical protein